MNPGQYRAQNEKITDKLRGMFEKATGKKVRLWHWHQNDLFVATSTNMATGSFQDLQLNVARHVKACYDDMGVAGCS